MWLSKKRKVWKYKQETWDEPSKIKKQILSKNEKYNN